LADCPCSSDRASYGVPMDIDNPTEILFESTVGYPPLEHSQKHKNTKTQILCFCVEAQKLVLPKKHKYTNSQKHIKIFLKDGSEQSHIGTKYHDLLPRIIFTNEKHIINRE
jgi:hypothetical protein